VRRARFYHAGKEEMHCRSSAAGFILARFAMDCVKCFLPGGRCTNAAISHAAAFALTPALSRASA